MKSYIYLVILFISSVTFAAATRVITADQMKSSDKTKTWTMPSVTDTFVGRITTDTLTNKTFGSSIFASTDASYDFGAASTRFNSGWFSNSLLVGSTTAGTRGFAQLTPDALIGGTIKLGYNGAWSALGFDGVELYGVDNVGYDTVSFKNAGTPNYLFYGNANTPIFTLTQSGLSLATALSIASGGTGQVTQAAALTALTGAQTSGKYVRSDGTNSALATIVAGDVPTLNQNTSGSAASLSVTLAVGSGGTGQTSYTDGQLLIGNTTGNTLAKATLTAGSGISITNGHGTITIADTNLSNPMTTTGDTIYSSDNSGTPARLAIGSSNAVHAVSSGGLPVWRLPTAPAFTYYTASGSKTYNLPRVFYVTALTTGPAVGDTYTNNSVTWTVYAAPGNGATQVVFTGNGTPSGSTLTRASGAGDATITFSAHKPPIKLFARLVGGGGGGGGSGSAACGTAATNGGDTNISNTTASKGTAGSGCGGTSGGPSGGIVTTTETLPNYGFGIPGEGGAMNVYGPTVIATAGGKGGGTPLGSGGIGAEAGVGGVGIGCGGGGAGGGTSGTVSAYPGVGGSAGAYAEVTLVGSLSTQYTPTVGAGGNGGVAGTGGFAGAAGAPGCVLIEADFQ